MEKTENLQPRMRFRRVGGSYQLDIQSAADFPCVLELDEALWALTSIDIGAITRVDLQFLQCLDSDRNGRVRSDEVKQGVTFLLEKLTDYSGIDRQSDILPLAAINLAAPGGADLLEAARLVLDNLEQPEADSISLAQVRNNRAILACAGQNGDGVLPPEALDEPELAALIKEMMVKVGSTNDRGGLPGISKVELDRYLALAQTYLTWRRQPEERPELVPFGERTRDLYGKLKDLREPIENFFLACGTLAFQGKLPAPEKAPATLSEYLRQLPAATPDEEMLLRLDAPLNPLWRDALLDCFAQPELARYLTDGKLTRQRWEELKNILTPYAGWLAQCPDTPFGELDRAALTALQSDDRVARLRAYMQTDLDAGTKIACCDRLCQLILYQRYMLEFLNNYVSLIHLFLPDEPSLLQAGTLVMDGRHFTLATVISDVASHKAVAQQSDICVMYLDCTTGQPEALKTMKLAVAVTSGHMRNLFIGKCGVFFTPGATWDAKVIDFIQQPVSISEAFVMPFISFGQFIGKQADKFFSTQSTAIQKNMENSITANAAQLPGTPTPPTSPPAVSGSMLLMGGGIGIAAIGSSVAFIAQAVQNISIGTVLAVLLGVILIFGGPVAVISLIKLYRRNVARFLEANRCAVNRSMRLTRKMGLIFTHAPPLPKRSLLNPYDLVNLLARPNARRRRLLYVIMAIVLIGALLAAGYYWGCHYIISN